MSGRTQPVVVGIDGSEHATRALGWAVEQARAERRPLALVHGTGLLTATAHDSAVISVHDVHQVLRENGEAVVRDALARVRELAPDLEVTCHVEVADPREALLTWSRTAALVVVGSRGRGPVASLLLGSVGVALARHAQCPVLVHRPRRQDAPAPDGGVVVAVDGRPESLPVLDLAWHQADLGGLPLTVLHCWWDVMAVAERSELVADGTPDREQEQLAVAEAIAGASAKYPDVAVRTRLVRGLPERAVAEAADSADLVVVGSHRLTRGQRLMFGSVSASVLEHAAGPVLVVPVGS